MVRDICDYEAGLQRMQRAAWIPANASGDSQRRSIAMPISIHATLAESRRPATKRPEAVCRASEPSSNTQTKPRNAAVPTHHPGQPVYWEATIWRSYILKSNTQVTRFNPEDESIEAIEEKLERTQRAERGGSHLTCATAAEQEDAEDVECSQHSTVALASNPHPVRQRQENQAHATKKVPQNPACCPRNHPEQSSAYGFFGCALSSTHVRQKPAGAYSVVHRNCRHSSCEVWV